MPKWLDAKFAQAVKMADAAINAIDSEALEEELDAIKEELADKGGNLEERFYEKSQTYTSKADEFEELKNEIESTREAYVAALQAVKDFDASME